MVQTNYTIQCQKLIAYLLYSFSFLHFLIVGSVHQRTKFRKDQSNRCGDIAIFVIFQMAAAAILNF